MEKGNPAMARMIACLDSGQYELALEQRTAAIQDHRCASGDYFRAIACRAMCDGRGAATAYLQAVALSHRDELRMLKDMLRWGLREATGYFNRGCAFHVEGDFDSAINNYTEALKLRPGWAPPLVNRGLALEARDRNNPAGPMYDERYGGTPDRDRAERDFMAVLAGTADERLRAIARHELEGLRAAPKGMTEGHNRRR